MADLRIEFEHHGEITDYRRSLDLDTAMAETAYRIGDVGFIRQAFATAPDNAIVIRLACDQPGALSFAVALDSPLRYRVSALAPDRLLLTGQAPKQVDPSYLSSDNPVIYDDEGGDGMTFAVCLAVRARGGRVTADDDRLRVADADEAIITLCAATSYNGFDRSPVHRRRKRSRGVGGGRARSRHTQAV